MTVGWWPAGRRWRREETLEEGGMKGQLRRVIGRRKVQEERKGMSEQRGDGTASMLWHLTVFCSSPPGEK